MFVLIRTISRKDKWLVPNCTGIYWDKYEPTPICFKLLCNSDIDSLRLTHFLLIFCLFHCTGFPPFPLFQWIPNPQLFLNLFIGTGLHDKFLSKSMSRVFLRVLLVHYKSFSQIADNFHFCSKGFISEILIEH